jgi:prolyl 4-hydroxylase
LGLLDEAKEVARRSGRPEDGIRFVETKAVEGDAEANLIVGHWHLYGSDRPRSPAVARQHLQVAADKGSTHATRIIANMTSGGIGCAPDAQGAISLLQAIADRDECAAAQLELLPRMMSDAEAAAVTRELLCDDPLIEMVHNLLLATECAYVRNVAAPVLRPSLVFEPGVDRGKADPIRRSEGAAFLPHDEDLVIQALNRRLASATGTGVAQREALYVIRYLPGEEYRPHFDALPGLTNQRERTAICYLNSGFGGGATSLPEVGVSVRGNEGDVLIFVNIDSGGRPDPRTRHAGEVVTNGEKWIATRWVRQRRHDPYENE